MSIGTSASSKVSGKMLGSFPRLKAESPSSPPPFNELRRPRVRFGAAGFGFGAGASSVGLLPFIFACFSFCTSRFASASFSTRNHCCTPTRTLAWFITISLLRPRCTLSTFMRYSLKSSTTFFARSTSNRKDRSRFAAAWLRLKRWWMTRILKFRWMRIAAASRRFEMRSCLQRRYHACTMRVARSRLRSSVRLMRIWSRSCFMCATRETSVIAASRWRCLLRWRCCCSSTRRCSSARRFASSCLPDRNSSLAIFFCLSSSFASSTCAARARRALACSMTSS
mmetsp:Transcript_16493/g.56187  ORF Transcript_16493/g.56187 Transcript_16493/m.56187 type:complete len:282 (+) Transcript_16493:1583-2428(+)